MNHNIELAKSFCRAARNGDIEFLRRSVDIYGETFDIINAKAVSISST